MTTNEERMGDDKLADVLRLPVSDDRKWLTTDELDALRDAVTQSNEAQSRAQQAHEALIASRGAFAFVLARIQRAHGLKPDDQINPETGEIRVAAESA